MCVDLAFLKGQFGPSVTWVGHEVRVNMRELAITVAIKQAFVEDLLDQAMTINGNNKISRKELRSFTGKANHVASLIWTWKPFLDELWATAEAQHRSNAGRHQVWTKQVAGSLKRLILFLTRQAGELSRTWSVASHLSPAADVAIVFDAPPWGLGAVLYIDNVPRYYLLDKITPFDEQRYQHRSGDHRGQQVWESLTILVALKAWSPIIMGRRFSWRLSVRGDNVTALNLVLRMKAKPGALKAIAKELAMLLASSPYRPTSAYHIAGLTNLLADALSRKHDPNKTDWHLPEQLKKVERTALPARDDDFYMITYTPRASGI